MQGREAEIESMAVFSNHETIDFESWTIENGPVVQEISVRMWSRVAAGCCGRRKIVEAIFFSEIDCAGNSIASSCPRDWFRSFLYGRFSRRNFRFHDMMPFRWPWWIWLFCRRCDGLCSIMMRLVVRDTRPDYQKAFLENSKFRNPSLRGRVIVFHVNVSVKCWWNAVRAS